MVQVAVDLVGIAVLLEQAAQDADAADPRTRMACARWRYPCAYYFPVWRPQAGRVAGPDARARVDNLRLADNESVLVEHGCSGLSWPWKCR